MDENKNVYTGIGIDFFLVILFGALGYFVYGGVGGALAMVILTILYALATFLSLIPFAGAFFQWLVMTYAIRPFVFHLTHIHSTWLTFAAFWVYLGLGIVLTAIMSLGVLGIVLDRLERKSRRW
jgi:hypothetical protein